jgi:hypothetical protein
MLLLNVPLAEGSGQRQYAMNTVTKAWTLFDGVAANCWAVFNGDLYYGGSTVVGKFWSTFADAGANIDTDLRQAFHHFGSRGLLKHFRMIRPIVRTDGEPRINLGINTDYQDFPPSGSITVVAANVCTWDVSAWDEAYWGGIRTITQWQSVGDIGTTAALRLQTSINGIELHLAATDYVYETGGAIG